MVGVRCSPAVLVVLACLLLLRVMDGADNGRADRLLLFVSVVGADFEWPRQNEKKKHQRIRIVLSRTNSIHMPLDSGVMVMAVSDADGEKKREEQRLTILFNAASSSFLVLLDQPAIASRRSARCPP